jgi:hypothetical protein
MKMTLTAAGAAAMEPETKEVPPHIWPLLGLSPEEVRGLARRAISDGVPLKEWLQCRLCEMAGMPEAAPARQRLAGKTPRSGRAQRPAESAEDAGAPLACTLFRTAFPGLNRRTEAAMSGTGATLADLLREGLARVLAEYDRAGCIRFDAAEAPFVWPHLEEFDWKRIAEWNRKVGFGNETALVKFCIVSGLDRLDAGEGLTVKARDVAETRPPAAKASLPGKLPGRLPGKLGEPLTLAEFADGLGVMLSYVLKANGAMLSIVPEEAVRFMLRSALEKAAEKLPAGAIKDALWKAVMWMDDPRKEPIDLRQASPISRARREVLKGALALLDMAEGSKKEGVSAAAKEMASWLHLLKERWERESSRADSSGA